MIEYRVYFGRDCPYGQVSEEELEDFCQLEINSRIPEYTLTNGVGYWEGTPESTWVMTVLVEDDLRNYYEEELGVIGQKYCEVFKQRTVLITSHQVKETWITAAPRVEEPVAA